jgi:hypothetical protein
VTPGARSFDLYLLSRMRALRQVDAALVRLSASREEMTEAAASVVRAGFEELVIPVRRYWDVLGTPDREEPETSVGVDSPFAGSQLFRFRRPPWPELDVAVRADRRGYAWGLSFLRGDGVQALPLTSAADLASWRFVRSEIIASFGAPRIEDAWSGWEDLSFELPDEPDGLRRRYLLRFDLDLLQEHVVFE